MSEDQTYEAGEKNALLNIGELCRENYEYFHISPETLMHIFTGLSPQMTGFELRSVMWNLWWKKWNWDKLYCRNLSVCLYCRRIKTRYGPSWQKGSRNFSVVHRAASVLKISCISYEWYSSEGSSVSIRERTFVVVYYILWISVSLKVSDFDIVARNPIRSLEFQLYWPFIYEHIHSDTIRSIPVFL